MTDGRPPAWRSVPFICPSTGNLKTVTATEREYSNALEFTNPISDESKTAR